MTLWLRARSATFIEMTLSDQTRADQPPADRDAAPTKTVVLELRCFSCDRELDWDGPSGDNDVDARARAVPMKATTFTSRGNYGSTVFDPSPHESIYLKVAICDECMKEHQERVLAVRYRDKTEIVEARPWDITRD
jgi:ribosomal protein L44E